MKAIKLITFITLAILSTNTFAYGSSSSKKACKKPKLSQFTPPHLSVVSPQSEFSFFASASTNPESIEVTIKKQAIETNINKTNKGYTVSGTLPTTLQASYARINVKVKGTNKCPENDGWLLKIKE